MLHLIHGPDIYRARQFIDTIIVKLKNIEPNINLQTIDGTVIQPAELSQRLEPMQLFSQKQLLIIKNLFSSPKQKSSQSIIDNFIAKPDPEITLIIWEQTSLDKRTSFYKKISKLSKNSPNDQTVSEFQLLKKPDLIPWLKQYCLQKNIKIEPAAIQQLVNISTNTYFLANEIQKLYTYTNNHITPKDIEAITPRQPLDIIFDLTDLIGKRQPHQAYQTAANLITKGEEPTIILATLATHIQNLLVVKQLDLQKKSLAQIISYTGIHRFVAGKCHQQSKNFTINQLKKIHHYIALADNNLKTGQSDFRQEIDKIIYC